MESSDVRFHSWRDKGIFILTGHTPVIFKDWLLQKRPWWGGGGLSDVFPRVSLWLLIGRLKNQHHYMSERIYLGKSKPFCVKVEIPFFPRPPGRAPMFFFTFSYIFAIKLLNLTVPRFLLYVFHAHWQQLCTLMIFNSVISLFIVFFFIVPPVAVGSILLRAKSVLWSQVLLTYVWPSMCVCVLFYSR